MRGTLEVQSGSQAGKQLPLRPGQIALVGRNRGNDLSLPDDFDLAGAHFALECGYDQCRLRNLAAAAGTLVNGQRVEQVALKDCDEITAGETTFVVRLGTPAPAA